MQEKKSNNKRIARNTILLYIRMFFWLIVTLYTSRVVLKILGVMDFGIYNVVAGFVSLFAFLNGTLSSSIQRFYNIEKGRNDIVGVNKIYSVGVVIHLFFAVTLFIVLETIGIWYINSIMVIPGDRLMAANVVFQAVSFSLFLTVFQIPYTGLVVAYEYMDFYALISIVDVVLKLLIVLALPFTWGDKLISYAILLSLVSVLNFVLYYAFVKKKIDGLTIRIKENSKNDYRRVLTFLGWNLYGTIIYSLKGQGVNLVLNVFGGPVVNAARGIATQIHSASNTFSTNITTAFRPQIVESYSKTENDRVMFLFLLESKICYAMILLVVVPLIMEIDIVLKLWLGGTIPEYTNIFSVLILVDLLFGAFNQPIVQVAFAVGNIKWFQIANSIVNLSLLPLCWIFLKLGYSPVSAFMVTIFVTICNQIVCFYSLSQIYDTIKTSTYLRMVVLPCLIATILVFMPQVLVRVTIPSGYLRLSATCLSHILLFCLVAYLVMLNETERGYVKRMYNSFVNKHIKKANNDDR